MSADQSTFELSLYRRIERRLCALPMQLHRNQLGSMSLVSLFGLLLLVILLGMVMNSGQQMDQKVKLQNAVDAGTYSGGIVLSRAMNTLAMTNHLLCDVFALTAYMREAQVRSSTLGPEELLDNWERISPILVDAEFPKFAALGPAIAEKVPHERALYQSYANWLTAASESILPVMETILSQRMIPQFQRNLVIAAPQIAQGTMNEVVRRHSQAWPHPATVHGVLWRTNVRTAGSEEASGHSTLPVVDPLNSDGSYLPIARQQRDSLAHRYLDDWNNETMAVFDHFGKMSQFANLWRTYTCGQLRQLLEVEYPLDNLPHVIRADVDQLDNLNARLENDFQFVGVAYRAPTASRIPGIFTNPLNTDAQAYAQVVLFVPRRRLVWWNNFSESVHRPELGGIPGHGVELPDPPAAPLEDDPVTEPEDRPNPNQWYVTRQDFVRHWSSSEHDYNFSQAYGRFEEAWNLLNQNWTVQMAPGTAAYLPQILSSKPNLPGMENVRVPDLSEITATDMQWLSNH